MLTAELRRHDYERYLLSLFAPANRRNALWAVLAFNLELARIPEMVSQPLLGQIRLTWWRSAVETALSGGDTSGSPLIAGLVEAFQAGALDRDCLMSLIDARERDLLRNLDSSIDEFIDHAGAIGVALTGLRLHALGIGQINSVGLGRHHGIAWALAARIKAVPRAAATGQWQEFATIGGVAAESLKGRQPTLAIVEAVSGLVARISDQLRQERTQMAGLPRAAFPAIGDGVIIERRLNRLRGVGFDPLHARLSMPDGLAPWSLGWRWLRRNF